MSKSKIEWTGKTWNFTTGCNKVSQGCKNCYAEKLALRLQATDVRKYQNGFKPVYHDYALKDPYKWKKPDLVFVNSMSDLFHKDFTLDQIQKGFDVMHDCSRHIYQILTKRTDRLVELADQIEWTPNIWIGTSVENEEVRFRIDDLRKVPTENRFLSLEPLLGPLPELNLDGIGWVIVGGESGLGARPIEREWVIDLRDQCKEANVPFFFKQWGGVHKSLNGKLLDGVKYEEYPSDMQKIVDERTMEEAT